jgi:hypothetical protein
MEQPYALSVAMTAGKIKGKVANFYCHVVWVYPQGPDPGAGGGGPVHEEEG